MRIFFTNKKSSGLVVGDLVMQGSIVRSSKDALPAISVFIKSGSMERKLERRVLTKSPGLIARQGSSSSTLEIPKTRRANKVKGEI